MHPLTSTLPPPVATSDHPNEAPEVAERLDALSAAIESYTVDPTCPETWQRLVAARRAAARSIAQLPKPAARGATAETVVKVIRQLTASGAQDYALEAVDAEFLGRLRGSRGPELLAAMTLSAAWRWADAPLLTATPDWLWGDYAAWLFAAPEGFTAEGDAERYAAHTLKHLGDFARAVEANMGSAAVRAAAKAWLQVASGIPLYFSRGDLRRHAELRGRILMRLHGREAAHVEPMAFSRAGRRLRIGFLNRHFGPQTETYTTLPTFEHLDPERFETVLFAIHQKDTPLERFCRSRAKEFHLLPADVEGQLAQLRAANLDVLVFGTNVTAVCNEVTRLALYRIAPLQVVNNSSCITSGLPHVDLYVSGTMTETAEAAAQFSERLGLLPGPAHAFDYEQDRQAPSGGWTRAALGLPEDAVVFVSAANYFKIIPEMQAAWARLLAAVPGSRLLLHPFNPNWSSTYPLKRFCADFDRVLAAHGVAGDRMVISSVKFPSRSDVKELLRVGDVYLDTFPFGGVNSLVDPLEIGLPVIAWEGNNFRSRMGAALLRSLGLDDLIARTETEYQALAASLATDAARRAAIGSKVMESMAASPLFLDSLAASDAFGELLETAFDELVATGGKVFRSSRTPVKAPPAENIDETLQAGGFSLAIGAGVNAAEHARAVLRGVPNHPAARVMLGRAYQSGGDNARAADYLLAALPHVASDADVWFELASAFRAQRRMPDAIEALETALRLDERRLDGWIMLGELARNVGSNDLAREAAAVARQLASDDPRVQALAATIA